MRLEIAILGITSFFIYNTYHDGKYTKMLLTFKKHYKMVFYAFLGIGIYIMLKKNPQRGQNMLMQANNYIKYMPIDKDSQQFLSPILDFTSSIQHNSSIAPQPQPFSQFNNKRMLNSGKNATKRSVSETKKKYVASRQEWKCENCSNQLDHTFEVDHRIRLEYGGGNDVHNLVALCRNCHGQKTAKENMESDI
jgi:5-methylcytosine-specific restriction enzyme A